MGNGAADGFHQSGGAGEGGLAGDRGQHLFAELAGGDSTGCCTDAGEVDGGEFLDQMRSFDQRGRDADPAMRDRDVPDDYLRVRAGIRGGGGADLRIMLQDCEIAAAEAKAHQGKRLAAKIDLVVDMRPVDVHRVDQDGMAGIVYPAGRKNALQQICGCGMDGDGAERQSVGRVESRRVADGKAGDDAGAGKQRNLNPADGNPCSGRGGGLLLDGGLNRQAQMREQVPCQDDQEHQQHSGASEKFFPQSSGLL